MYADDTTLTTSAEDPCVLEHKMNYDMNLIQSWLSANKLTLNVKKTKYMLIGGQFKLSQINSDFTVKVNNKPLSLTTLLLYDYLQHLTISSCISVEILSTWEVKRVH